MDPFLRESWGDLSSRESEGHDFDELATRQEEKAEIAYTKIKNIKDHSKIASELVKSIQESIVRYVKTIDKLSSAKIKKEDPKEREEADLARRLAYNALISNLDILNRYCVKNNLDRSWRDVVGLERKQVTTWALAIADKVIKERID